MKVTESPTGAIQKVHPNPNERCNMDDAARVKEMTLGELVAKAFDDYTETELVDGLVVVKPFDAAHFDAEHVCHNCGGE